LYQVPKAQVQVQVSITPDQVGLHGTPDVLEHGQLVVSTGTQIGRLIEFYSTETAKVLKR